MAEPVSDGVSTLSDKGVDIPNWYNLPVRVLPEQVVTVELPEKEVAEISSYGDRMFDKATIDRMSSQYKSSRGLNKRNPNTTGIKGEWAGLKYFLDELADLSPFLNERPWKMADMGDALIIGKKPLIFDYKTRTRKASVAELVESDELMAEMDAKFADTNKYGYLDAFIFCVNNEADKTIHLMGWMLAKEFFQFAQRFPRGTKIPGYHWSYEVDELMLPYRRLRPMEDLKALNYYPVTENVTLDMRKVWNRTGYVNLEHYVKQITDDSVSGVSPSLSHSA